MEPSSGSFAVQRQVKVSLSPCLAGQTRATPVPPSTSMYAVSRVLKWRTCKLTTSQGIAGQVDDWAGGRCAIHWHADAGSIALVLVANVEGGKEGVTADGREAGSS